MANTLKFGNGQWYGKKDTILAYNDENKNYKPLPFSFDRASSATVVNKQGLIETVGSGEPRIDYKDDSKGALLLEPSRSNLVTYSEKISQNTSTGLSFIDNDTNSPNGLSNASKVTEASGGSIHYVGSDLTGGANEYSWSCFLKQGTTRYAGMRAVVNGFVNRFFVNIDLSNGSVVDTKTVGSGVTWEYRVKEYPNGWYRLIINAPNTSGNMNLAISPSDVAQPSYLLGLPTFSGNTSNNFYVWGVQFEQGSYATSYIPTQGSAVTRVADDTKIVNSPILQATNQFTLFFDAKDFLNDGATFANIMITLGAAESPYDAGTGIHIYNKVWFYYNGSSAVNLGDCYNATTDSKFAISYDGTKFTTYSNGVKLGTNTTSASMSNWDTLTDGSLSYSGVDRIFNIADLKLYNTALSDSELQALTQV